jgi:hypothetical protein
MTSQTNTMLLVANDGRILDQGPFDIDEHTIASANGIHPKHILPEGWQIVEPAGMPSDFAFGRYRWRDGILLAVSGDPPTAEQLAVARSARSEQVNAWRSAASQACFAYQDKQFSCDPQSRQELDGIANTIALSGAFPPGFPGYWKAADNTPLPLPDIASFAALYGAMVERNTRVFNLAQELKQRIADAATVAGIEAVRWTDETDPANHVENPQ